MQSEALADVIVQTLDQHKAIDIRLLNVHNLTNLTQFMIVASGNSSRQTAALAEHVQDALRTHKIKPRGVEGDTVGEWVLLDYNDVIVHIMLPEIREFYNLEKLWTESKGSSSKE